MRGLLIVSLSCAILLVGCNGGSQPEAKRAEPTNPPNGTASSGGTQVAEPLHSNAATQDAPAAADSDTDGKLQLEKLAFSIPQGWQRKPTASSFVLAEFTLPRAEGDDADGRLTVSAAGGSVEANVQRWRDQFGGKPEQSSEGRQEVSGLEVVFVDFAGEFNDQRGPNAPATKRQGYRMLAAIVTTDGELHFVKAVGPQATIAAHADRFREFVGSMTKK